MWNNIESLRSLSYSLSWISLFLVLAGSGVFAGARLIVDRRIAALAEQHEAVRTAKEAALRRDLAESQSRVHRLEEFQRPRSISDDLRKVLLTRLSNAEKFPILVGSVAEGEPVQLAQQYSAVFRDAGWEVKSTQYLDVHGTGIGILVKGAAAPAVVNLQDIFAAAGVPVTIETVNDSILQGHLAVVFVGSKQPR